VRYVLVFLLALATTLRADVVRILDDPREAAQARVDVIQQAGGGITMLYFLARDDRITLSVLALLRDAKRRGVGDVRVIVDGSFHRIPKDVLAHLGDEGVEVRVYHPLSLRHPSWLLRRMHEKVIVADSSRYITGGRNLGEAYFGLAKKKNYVDRDVFIEGASSADAQRHFESLWSSKHVAELHLRVPAKEKQRASERLDRVLADLVRTGFIALDTRRDWTEDAKQVESVRFLHDPVTRNAGVRVAVPLMEILESARQSIVIESPYFVPSTALRRLLRRKLTEGVEVLVITNSLRSTDGLLPQGAYLKYRRRLARAGVEFHEYKGPDPLHAKSIIVDGKTALIGSYNIDPRSQYLNTEVMCATEDEEVARELRASIEAHMKNSWTIRRAARGPHVSRVTALRLWFVRMLLPIVEPQL
jgi:cardiolipin synthase C